MNTISDITTLKEYQDYKEADKNAKKYKRKIQQMEQSIDKRFQSYKTKLQEAEKASNFKEEQELKDEANELKAEAEKLQQQLEEFKEKSPHYGNLRGEAKRKLVTEGRKFVGDLEEDAQEKLDEAIAILRAIQKSKQKFDADEVKFFPTVTHQLERLEHIQSTF